MTGNNTHLHFIDWLKLNGLGVSRSQSIPDIRLEEASTHDPSGPGEVLVKMKHTISSLELLPLTSPDSRWYMHDMN